MYSVIRRPLYVPYLIPYTSHLLTLTHTHTQTVSAYMRHVHTIIHTEESFDVLSEVPSTGETPGVRAVNFGLEQTDCCH